MTKRLVAVALLVALLGASCATSAAAREKTDQVVIVVVGGLGLADLRGGPMPFARSLIDRSAVGLANSLGVGKAGIDRSSVTIGAGARAQVTPLVDPALNAAESIEGTSASEIYRRRTGYAPEGYAVLDVGLPALDMANRDLSYHMIPGLLGEALRRAGKANAMYGNQDTALANEVEAQQRHSAYIAMDAKGRVKYGDIGKGMLSTRTAAAYGVISNTKRLLDGYRSVRDKAGFVVLDFGDVMRAERYQLYVTPRVAARQRKEAVERADAFLKALAGQLAPAATLIVLSPVGPARGGANSLTPIIVHGPAMKPGLLTSPVTQRQGLVNLTDVAPSVLEWFGLPPRVEFLGAPMHAEGEGTSGMARLTSLVSLYDRASAESALRSTITGGYTLLLSLVLIGVVVLLFSKEVSTGAAAVSRWLLVAVVSAPLAAYLMWFLRPPNSPRIEMILAFVGLGVLLPSLAVAGSRSSAASLMRVCAATVVFVVIDQLAFAGRLIMSTFYGYSPVDGARYYGMGNETWAILIGALLVVAAYVVDFSAVPAHIRDWGIGVAFVAAVVLLGFPALGANAAGVVGASVALATAFLRFREKKIGLTDAIVILSLIVLLVASFAVYDAMRPPTEATHIGRSARLIAGKGGLTELVLLVQRKTMSNLKVMARTRWSYVLLLILAVLGVLTRRPTGLFAETLSRRKGLAGALTGGLLGGFEIGRAHV